MTLTIQIINMICIISRTTSFEDSKHAPFDNTGFPRYSRSFYLRFCLFAIKESIPKLKIRGLCLTYSRFSIVFDIKSSLIKPFWGNTVLPHYSQFQNSRCFARSYLPRKTSAACNFHISKTCFTFSVLDLDVDL